MSLENRVPVVDLAEIIRPDSRELNSKSPYLAKVVKNIQNACIQWGFFYVTGHGVSDQLINELKSVSKEFFKKSKDFKKQVQRQPDNYRGYTDNELTKQTLDWKELFDYGVEPEATAKKIDLDNGRNQWPEDMPDFKRTLLEYFSEMHGLGSLLMDLIFMGLGTNPEGMRNYFNESSDTSFCRLNYYPVYQSEGANQLGVGPHSDAGVLTILLQDDNVSSLQVQKDAQFYDVSPIPGSFVINIGDMMQVWSNGVFKAPVHRVLTNKGKERFSVPFFFNPAYEADVKPLEQCVTSDQPCLYRPVNWGIFRRGRILGDYADYGEEIQISHFEIKKL